MEKIALILDHKTSNAIGIIIVDEIEIGYIKPKVTFYVEKEGIFNKKQLQAILGDLSGGVIKVSDLVFKLEIWAYNGREIPLYDITDFIYFISNNKNKSIRNKNALKELGINNYERIALKLNGKKIT